MSSFWSTIIGAAAAIVGGLGAALWQTRRADDIARRIRREERQEQALLVLFNQASDVLFRLIGIARAAATAPLTSQYEAARQAVTGLSQLWDTDLIAVITDKAIRTAMLEFSMRSRELLPGGADAMVQYKEDDPGAKAEHFIDDLGQLIELLPALRGKVLRAMDPRLLSPNPPRYGPGA
jgi:hypothetical protein